MKRRERAPVRKRERRGENPMSHTRATRGKEQRERDGGEINEPHAVKKREREHRFGVPSAREEREGLRERDEGETDEPHAVKKREREHRFTIRSDQEEREKAPARN